MRLFIALPLTKGFLSKIAFLEEKIEKKMGFKLPWIPLKNLHLTILFLGYLNYEDYLKVEEIFESFNLFKKPIDLKIKKIDYGPPGIKRMLWLYVEKNKELEEIKEYFENELSLRKVKYKREEREFLPHINLVRLKKTKNLPEIFEELNFSVRLKEICLFQSILKKEGAEYEKLKSIYLD